MTIQDYVNEGLEYVINQMREVRKTKHSQYRSSIIFPNGYVVIIINKEYSYSVAVCDYEGYFNWSLLDRFNENEKSGAVICYTEDEVCRILEYVKGLGSDEERK